MPAQLRHRASGGHQIGVSAIDLAANNVGLPHDVLRRVHTIQQSLALGGWHQID
jgi:hypothetical protein